MTPPWKSGRSGEDAAIRAILEGTATETGNRFFAALVKSLCEVLGVSGAWVTEYLRDARRLRALAFWFEGRCITHYEYDISGTPCEPVIQQSCLIHFPENIVNLFPHDPDLRAFGAVSYMGVPLTDTDGAILGHLAALDTKPMPADPRAEALFRIFAARAGAELRRLRAEAQVTEREEQLSRLVNSALDAILELDAGLVVTKVNRAGAEAFGCESDAVIGADFRRFLAAGSGKKLERLTQELSARPAGQQYLWIPGGFQAVRCSGESFPAEASLSRFENRGRTFFTLILRNINDRLEAERKIESLALESAYLKEELAQLQGMGELVGRSRPMLQVFESIRQVGPTDATVLIYGETGTGKELVARAIHEASLRARSPMIRVNCAAIPSTLIESEFFGHEKGAFTGATQRREGRFALAHRGTIFLDEIGELPIDLQAKLLRILQEGEFEPVGSSLTRKVDVRVIAATNRDLQQAIREGKFREDLYYRLSVFPIRVPPLRERESDVECLAEAFLEKFSRKLGKQAPALSPECRMRLRSYSWPGNVRELQNVMERAVILSRGVNLDLSALVPLPAPPPPGVGETGVVRTATEIRDAERANIIRALESTGWRVAGPNGAGRLLGLPASTLASRMKALGIRRPDRR